MRTAKVTGMDTRSTNVPKSKTAIAIPKRTKSIEKKTNVSIVTPRTMPATSLFFLKKLTTKAIGVLATTKPTKYTYRNPGGTRIVPKLVPAKYPMAHPIAVDVTPTVEPRRMLDSKYDYRR